MKFIRVPIITTLRKSPFKTLKDHANIIKESANLLKEEFKDYINGHFEEFEEKRKKIEELELKADYVKSNIRNHLPQKFRMPVDRGTFLSLIGELDKAVAIFHLSKLVFLLGEISNHAENAGDRIRALLAR